jgi:diguanylate cyclase (GGDEF)-like protein
MDNGRTGASGGKTETVVRSVLNAIQILTSENNKPGIEQIIAMVQCDPGISELLNPSSGPKMSRKDEILQEKKEMETLRAQLQKSMTARRAMVVQLDTAERQLEKTKEFMLRAFLVTMRYVDAGKDRQLNKAVSRIRDLLKTRAPLHELDAAFQQLKEYELKGEFEETSIPTPATAGQSGDAGLEHPSGAPESVMGRFKKRYRKIIDGLKSSLDAPARKDMAVVEQRLDSVLAAYDLLEVHRELRKLLKTYVQRLSREREQAAEFILEIEERLVEVQRRVLQCSTTARETGEAGVRFTTAVEQEMVRMQDGVDTAGNLEELKSRVVGSIGLLKEAIEEKRKDEWTQAQKMDEEMSSLNKKLERMNLEISSARKRTERLETEILMDSLTGAYSRRAYDQQVEEMFKAFQRDRRPFSILLMDVDGFKHINSQYGRGVGDVCLKGLAGRVRPFLRDIDFLSRYGADEFVIVLPGVMAQGAGKAAEKVRTHIEKTNFLHKGELVRVTISIGVVQVDSGVPSPGHLLGLAEQALLRAKSAGGNQVAA